jgi:tetratricopeptide (TPR) repeat protein
MESQKPQGGSAMSRMLKLVDELLSRSRHLHKLGCQNEAFDVLIQLAQFRGLPIDVAEEVEVRLGESYLRQRRYKRARGHLVAAVRLQPGNARYHHLLATAFRRGTRPNPKRAVEHYLRSLELEPRRAARLCAYGAFLVQLGQSREGLRHLRRAAEAAPYNVRILKQAVKGLRLANQNEEARRLLLAARFRAPHNRRLLSLWNDFQFQQIRNEQQTALHRFTTNRLESPVLLPFVRLSDGRVPSRQTRAGIRQDGPSGTPSPRSILRVRRPGQRHAL